MTAYIEEVANKGVNLVISRGKKKAVMLVSIDEFNKNQMDDTEFLMSNEKNREELLQSIEDVKNKRYKVVDIDELEKRLCD
jgi:PHD/YefM family antitoxin component YafN of YafNO toxin-antitoxin module